MTTPIPTGVLFATDVARVHVTATIDDPTRRLVFRGAATVIAVDGPNGVLIAKTDEDREVRIPVDLVRAVPVGGAR